MSSDTNLFMASVFTETPRISMGDLCNLIAYLDGYTDDKAEEVFDDHPQYREPQYHPSHGGWVHVVMVHGQKKPETLPLICELCHKKDPTVRFREYKDFTGQPTHRHICQDCYDTLSL